MCWHLPVYGTSHKPFSKIPVCEMAVVRPFRHSGMYGWL